MGYLSRLWGLPFKVLTSTVLTHKENASFVGTRLPYNQPPACCVMSWADSGAHTAIIKVLSLRAIYEKLANLRNANLIF